MVLQKRTFGLKLINDYLEREHHTTYFLLGLEDVAAEDITLSISGDIAENLQILGVMRHVEYPERSIKIGQKWWGE